MENLGKIVFTCAKPSKGTAAGGGLSAHIERQIWDATKKCMVPFKPDSVKHPEKTALNKEYILPSDVSRSEAIEKRIKDAGITRKIRANQVRCLTFLCTSDKKTMDRIVATGRFEDYAQACIDFCKLKFGDRNVVSAVAHFDETTAHLHISVVPIVDGPAPVRAETKKQHEARNGKEKRAYKKQNVTVRLCAKEVFTPEKAEQWQDDIVEFLHERGFDFQRGQKGSQAKHVNPADYNAMMEELRALNEQKETLENDVEIISSEYNTILEEVQKKEKTVKGLNTIITNLEKKRDDAIANGEAVSADIEAKIEDKKQKLAKATSELDDILQKKNDAEKDLKSAQNNVMTLIFRPGKHKKVEDEKYNTAYNKGVEDTMSTILSSMRLKFSSPPTPESIGKGYRSLWDAKKVLTQQVSDEKEQHAHYKELYEKSDAENSQLHNKVDSLSTCLSYSSESRVSSLEKQCQSQTERADRAESKLKSLTSQLQLMLNDPTISSRWQQIQEEQEEEKQRKESILRILNSWIADAIKTIKDYALSHASIFSKEAENTIFRGIIAQAHIDKLDATDDASRLIATNNLLAKVSWSGATEYMADLATTRTHQLCEEVSSLTQNVIDAVLAPVYSPQTGGGGSNDNSMTNWDGTKRRNGWGI